MKHINFYTKLYSFIIFNLICLPLQTAAQQIILKSPNGKIELSVFTEEQLSYSIKRDNQLLLDKSPVGLILEDQILGIKPKINRQTNRSLVKENITTDNYKCSSTICPSFITEDLIMASFSKPVFSKTFIEPILYS